MSLIKPKFAYAANALCHVSVANRNALSHFLKVGTEYFLDESLYLNKLNSKHISID